MNLTLEDVKYAIATRMNECALASMINLNDLESEVKIKVKIGALKAKMQADLKGVVGWMKTLPETLAENADIQKVRTEMKGAFDLAGKALGSLQKAHLEEISLSTENRLEEGNKIEMKVKAKVKK